MQISLRSMLLLLTLSACQQQQECDSPFPNAAFDHTDVQSSISIKPGQGVAQSFFLPGDGNQSANRLAVMASSSNPNDPNWSYTLRELTDSDDPTAGPVVAQGNTTIAAPAQTPGDANDMTLVSFDDGNALTLLGGKPYWFIVTPPADTNVTFGVTDANSYVGHLFTSSANGWQLSSNANQLAFSLDFYLGCD